MIGREHHAEGRDNSIETGVGKTQRFRIGFLEFNRQASAAARRRPRSSSSAHNRWTRRRTSAVPRRA